MQDLPNNMMHSVTIKSLPQEWLWCETWCDDASKQYAKTIDLVSLPHVFRLFFFLIYHIWNSASPPLAVQQPKDERGQADGGHADHPGVEGLRRGGEGPHGAISEGEGAPGRPVQGDSHRSSRPLVCSLLRVKTE